MIDIPIHIVPINAFSPSLPKLWHFGADVIHLLPYIQSMISDEDETENSNHVGEFSECSSILPSITPCLQSSFDLQEAQGAVERSELQTEQYSDDSTIDIKQSYQTLGDFPEKKKVRRQLHADKITNSRELTLSRPRHSQPTQARIGEQAVTNNDLTLPGPSHSRLSTATYRELADFENDLALPGPSYCQLSTAAYGEIAASNNDLTLPGPSHCHPSIVDYRELAASNRRLTQSESTRLYLGELTASSRILTLPSSSQNYPVETPIEKLEASEEVLTICTPSLSQPTVSPFSESEASNRVLTLSTPLQFQPVPTTNGELATSSKSFISIVDGIEDIADVDNIVGMVLLYQHLFDKRTSPCEVNDFDVEELDNFTIQLEKLDRIYYVYHFDDRVSSREYELLARMNYNGSKVFVHLSVGCDYTGFDFQGTGEIYVTRKANFFLKSVVDGSNKPERIWQALEADGYNVSEPTEFDLLPPGLWQSVPTLTFLSHMAVYQHRDKLAFYPEVLPPLLRHNLDEFIQVRSTKDHHDS